MGHVTDIRIERAVVGFGPVAFETPLRLGSGTIVGLTEATVRVHGVNRAGQSADGLGSVLLSHVWAGGTDELMRAAASTITQRAVSAEFADPLEHGERLLRGRRDFSLPDLAVDVAGAPVDQAVHDAWSKAAGRPAYRMYGPEYLNHDLGRYLGPDFAGRWPREWLRPVARTHLPVQYVIGLGDPLPADPQYRWLKVKLGGDLEADRYRIRQAVSDGVSFSVDPNESYRSAADVTRLRTSAAAAYMEQPVPRGRPGPGPGAIPVLADEGLPAARDLDGLTGWDGVVVKTCRGQTTALLTYCWAKRRGRFVVQQDLTHVGPALAHAAAFAAHCDYSVPAFECNSLQYAPAGNAELRRDRPGLVSPVDGTVSVEPDPSGIR
jgi:hypothetical protein